MKKIHALLTILLVALVSGAWVIKDTANPVDIYTGSNSTPSIRVETTGKIGVNNTGTQQEQLNVGGNVHTFGTTPYYSLGTAATSLDWHIKDTGSAGSFGRSIVSVQSGLEVPTNAFNISQGGQVTSFATSASLALQSSGGTGNASRVDFLNSGTNGTSPSSGKFNFRIGNQVVASNKFEIVPSTAADGTTFSTAGFSVDNNGLTTIGSNDTLRNVANGRWLQQTSVASGADVVVQYNAFQNSGTADPRMLYVTSRGTVATSAALQANDFMMQHEYLGVYDTASDTAIGAQIIIQAAGAWSSATVHPTKMLFSTSPASGADQTILLLNSDGSTVTGSTSLTPGAGIYRSRIDDSTLGLQIRAGATSSDRAMLVQTAAGVNIMQVVTGTNDGGLIIGSATNIDPYILLTGTSTSKAEVDFQQNGTTRMIMSQVDSSNSITPGTVLGDFVFRSQGKSIFFTVDSGTSSMVTLRNAEQMLQVKNTSGAGTLSPLSKSCAVGNTDFDSNINGTVGFVLVTIASSVAGYTKAGSGMTLVFGALPASNTVTAVTGSQSNSAVRIANATAGAENCLVTFLNHY